MVRAGDRVRVREHDVTGTIVRVYSAVKSVVLDDPAIVVRFDRRLPNGDGYDVVTMADIEPVTSMASIRADR
ncbi:MAG: hypothetical protein ABFD52_08985 [Acidobacteriota bacterium]